VSWDAVGAIGEVVGAVAVVASLVYLARQIRQNSSLVEQSALATRAEAAAVSAGHGADSFRRIASDAELSRIWRLGMTRPGDLQEDEGQRFDLLILAQFIEINASHELYRSGVLAPEIWAIWDGIIETWLGHPRFLRLWDGGLLPSSITVSLAAHVRAKLAARGGASS
jgi:hypothetical protein